MSQMNGKYDVKELNGRNCAIVEDGVSDERAGFLIRVLEYNGYQVQVAEKLAKTAEGEEVKTYTVGVTDITFNPSLAIYSRHLKTLEGKVLLPAYWFNGEGVEEWYWKERIK